ncbi:DUF6175 family protein [Flavobacterium algicola]|uniref:DUF6175 family protein n=1 Tax=Flavobacterium algicola TaxID=556529 RepID=UPI001EFCD681|nr:DUF6175 family protein [Flavobacterium algicola]MCG9791164.1 DUF6175 family protein [Flavobacterium algicola]
MKRIIIAFLCSTVMLYSQAKKPSIMIFPANVWMVSNGYVSEIDNQGSKVQVMDYQKAFDNNADLYSVVNKIENMMKERGFPLENLASSLKDLVDKKALNNMDANSNGSNIASSPRDMLLATARPDIVLEITWSVNTLGPKKSVTFDLKGLDAGTNKNIASAGGTGNQLMGAILPIMLETAVLSHIDNFNGQLMTHFDDMFENGREISLDIKVWDDSPKKLNDEINEDGDELKDDIKKWVTTNTVKGRNKLINSSPNMMTFKEVRIPIYAEDGTTAFDADAFATNLRKHLRKTYKLPAESSAIGLGKSEVVIGGKR